MNADLPAFLRELPRHAFFTGKGGVGKTSVACAAAVQLADRGLRVLLVSTDPASNVGQVLDQVIGNRITPIAAVPGLDAIEIDPQRAAAEFRERVVGPVRGLLPDAEIAAITEQLSGACTLEISAFNEFTDLLTDPGIRERYDHVLFDTAPTGHTIRLLQLPGDWTGYLAEGTGDASCLGPLAGLDTRRRSYAAAVAALTDPGLTRLVLVARPQPGSLSEVARTLGELGRIGMGDPYLVVGGVLADTVDDPMTDAIRSRERDALAHMPAAVADLPRTTLPLRPFNIMGVDALRRLFTPVPDAVVDTVDVPVLPDGSLDLAELVDELAMAGPGLVMCMGKGGVGKTTVAAAIAVALADRGHRVLLTTTDPAAHLTGTLAGDVDGLEVSRIDPVAAVADYRQTVMRTKGAQLDDAGRAVLAEDLRSPCTEEIAVFEQFSRAVERSDDQFVVIDTAPTGHTLLLLDATGSYHREMARQAGSGRVTPLTRLQDAGRTRVILVTLPEATPVMEARALQADLGRAGIVPWAAVVNQSLVAAVPSSPFLRARAAAEARPLIRAAALSARTAVIALRSEDPVGADALRELATIRQPAPAASPT